MRYGYHILGWLLYIAVEFLANYFHYPKDKYHILVLDILIYLPVIVLAVYWMTQSALPRYFTTKRKWLLWLEVFIVLVIVYISRYVISNVYYNFSSDHTMLLPFSKVIKNTIRDYSVIALAVCLIIISDWRNKTKRIRSLEKSQAEMELSLLLNQLQPHFLFNTFNNIYSLVRKDAEEGAEALLRLSSVMEYVVYQRPRELVSIPDEMKVVRDFISLQRLKYGEQLRYKESLTVSDTDKLPSLVILSLVENAFKHGGKSEGFFQLNIEAERAGSRLCIAVKNSLGSENKKVETGGHIGNENLRKRLEVYFGDKQELQQVVKDGIFEVRIEIEV